MVTVATVACQGDADRHRTWQIVGLGLRCSVRRGRELCADYGAIIRGARMHDDESCLAPTAVLRDLSHGDVESAIDAQLATGTLSLPPEQLPSARDLDYTTTEQFWGDMLAERLRARRFVTLHRVLLFEWFPRSPGLWYTPRAEWSRQMAAGHTLHLTDEEHSLYLASNPPDPVVYDLYGKQAMLDGGIGCVRLNRRITPHGPLWFMSASSSPHADRGVPLAVTDQDYDAVIESIIDDGAVLCTVAGMLMSLPDGLLNLYRDYAGVPRLYLLVSEITREPRQDQPPPGLLRANAAVLFSTDAPWSAASATYIDFVPGGNGNLSQRLEWLHYYVRNLHDGTILTDFDEQMTRFPERGLLAAQDRQRRARPDRDLQRWWPTAALPRTDRPPNATAGTSTVGDQQLQ